MKKQTITKAEKEMILYIEGYSCGLTRFDVENQKYPLGTKSIEAKKVLAKLEKKGLVTVKKHVRNYTDLDNITRQYHRKFEDENYILR